MVELFQKILVGSAETAEKALNALLALFDEKNRKLPSMGRARKISVRRDGKVETVDHMMAGVIYELGHHLDEKEVVHLVVKGVTAAGKDILRWQIDVGLPPSAQLKGGRGLEKIEGVDFGLFPGDTSDILKVSSAVAKN